MSFIFFSTEKEFRLCGWWLQTYSLLLPIMEKECAVFNRRTHHGSWQRTSGCVGGHWTETSREAMRDGERRTGWGRGAIREILTHRKEEMDERKITASRRNRGSFSQR